MTEKSKKPGITTKQAAALFLNQRTGTLARVREDGRRVFVGNPSIAATLPQELD